MARSPSISITYLFWCHSVSRDPTLWLFLALTDSLHHSLSPSFSLSQSMPYTPPRCLCVCVCLPLPPSLCPEGSNSDRQHVFGAFTTLFVQHLYKGLWWINRTVSIPQREAYPAAANKNRARPYIYARTRPLCVDLKLRRLTVRNCVETIQLGPSKINPDNVLTLVGTSNQEFSSVRHVFYSTILYIVISKISTAQKKAKSREPSYSQA